MATTQNGIKLTKTIVDKLEAIPGKTQSFFRDDSLKGFALRITASGVKSFIVETRINGKVKRVTLGKYGALTVEEARKQAKGLLGVLPEAKIPLLKRRPRKLKH